MTNAERIAQLEEWNKNAQLEIEDCKASTTGLLNTIESLISYIDGDDQTRLREYYEFDETTEIDDVLAGKIENLWASEERGWRNYNVAKVLLNRLLAIPGIASHDSETLEIEVEWQKIKDKQYD